MKINSQRNPYMQNTQAFSGNKNYKALMTAATIETMNLATAATVSAATHSNMLADITIFKGFTDLVTATLSMVEAKGDLSKTLNVINGFHPTNIYLPIIKGIAKLLK
jgi:hypothetical protein